MRTTDALNLTSLPRRVSAAEIDDFRVEAAHAPGGARGWAVTGEALARFAAMTNWDYYEASLRFQKVLEVAGAPPGFLLEGRPLPGNTPVFTCTQRGAKLAQQNQVASALCSLLGLLDCWSHMLDSPGGFKV